MPETRSVISSSAGCSQSMSTPRSRPAQPSGRSRRVPALRRNTRHPGSHRLRRLDLPSRATPPDATSRCAGTGRASTRQSLSTSTRTSSRPRNSSSIDRRTRGPAPLRRRRRPVSLRLAQGKRRAGDRTGPGLSGLERHALARNYRCPTLVVDASRSLISRNRRRFPKQILAARSDPARSCSRALPTWPHRRVKRPGSWGDLEQGQAVILARTARVLSEVALGLAQAGIRFFGPERIKRQTGEPAVLLAYVRLLGSPLQARPQDVISAFRVPNRYLPDGAEDSLASGLRSGLFVLGCDRTSSGRRGMAPRQAGRRGPPLRRTRADRGCIRPDPPIANEKAAWIDTTRTRSS